MTKLGLQEECCTVVLHKLLQTALITLIGGQEVFNILNS